MLCISFNVLVLMLKPLVFKLVRVSFLFFFLHLDISQTLKIGRAVEIERGNFYFSSYVPLGVYLVILVMSHAITRLLLIGTYQPLGFSIGFNINRILLIDFVLDVINFILTYRMVLGCIECHSSIMYATTIYVS